MVNRGRAQRSGHLERKSWEPQRHLLARALSALVVIVVLVTVVNTVSKDPDDEYEQEDTSHLTALPFDEHLDEFGVSRDGAPTGDLDGAGNSLSAQALAAAGWRPGVSVTLLGTPVVLPEYGPGRPDHLISAGQRVALKEKRYQSLTFLATATRTDASPAGAQGRGRVVYTDGTEQDFTLTVPDWAKGPAGDAALTLPYANSEGETEPSLVGSVRLYARSVPVDPLKEIAHVSLPRVGDEAASLHMFALGGRPAEHPWTGTWYRAGSGYVEVGPWEDQTLRLAARTTAGGHQVRIRLDNTFAQESVTIGAVSVALRGEGAGVRGAPVALTFDGQEGTTIPAGGQVHSDPVEILLPPHSDVLVSVHLPEQVRAAPVHYGAADTSYSTPSGGGDQTLDDTGTPFTETLHQWPFLAGIEVMDAPGAIVALGDSITDGIRSTRDAHNRWPDVLSRRLATQDGLPQPPVLNAGVAGNHVVTDGYPGEGVSTNATGVAMVHRLPRDVLAQGGAETLVVFAGINDLRWGASALEVIGGLTEVAETARAHDMRVFVATLGPCGGELRCTAEVDEARQYVNSFLREQIDLPDSVFDGVWDFDAVLRDPQAPSRLLPEYDSGDHLHPGDAGLEALAHSIDLGELLAR